jgi:hypothetical protein
VNTLIRGLGLGLLLSSLLILPGCGTDNDSAADKLQASSGAVPTPEKGTTKDVAPPKAGMTYDDYAKSKQGVNPYADAKYPGAKK